MHAKPARMEIMGCINSSFDFFTKQDDVKVLHMILAQSKEPCSVSQQCVLVASESTDIVDDKDITTLNVAQL